MTSPNLSLRTRWFAGAASILLALFAAGPLGCADDTDGTAGDAATGTDVQTDAGTDVDTGSPPPDDTGVDTGPGDSGPGYDGPTFDTQLPDAGDGGLKPMDLQTITPDRGPVSGGTQFVITGDGFTSETSVFIGGREATVHVVDGNLVGQTPEGAGPGAVSVKALDPESGRDHIPDGFTYTTPLEIHDITPSRIPTDGGIEVRIDGQGFDQSTRVSFAGRTASSHNVVGPKTLRVKAPANAAGPADVRVTSRDGSVVRRDGVEYYEPLTVDRVRPATGSTSGGDRVTLHGTGFKSGMTVSFGGTRGTVQSVQPDGEAAAIETPAHAAGLVDVAVQTPSGNGDVAKEAFYYRSSTSDFAIAAVRPDYSKESGNVDVTLIGSGLGRSGLNVSFGGKAATIGSTGPGHAEVTVPAHTPGVVDVSISDGSGANDTLVDGFEYVPDLEISSVQPAKGPAGGGTSVTLTGTGFQGVSRVEFGGEAAQFSVTSDTTITATTPKHPPGTVDVAVERDPAEARAEEAFAFTEQLEVFGLSPVRGSMAGNTYVEIRGRGFLDSQMTVQFGGSNAKSIRVLDTQTIVVRTPRHDPGAVDVTVGRDGTTVTAPEQYTYFNPGSNDGGVWGGPIQGSVNVSVFSVGGNPIDGAYVQLSTNAESEYAGSTDARGQVTLSGPDLYGEQTITATAAGHTSTTVQNVNSENVTIFLTPLASGGSPPPGPPTAKFSGRIYGLEKIASPAPNEYLVAVVFPTQESPWEQIEAYSENTVTQEGGSYRLETRVGDLALVAFGGLMNTDTNRLTPLRMGVVRYQSGESGETYNRDINLDIPLDNTMRFKLQDPPQSSDGPDVNQVVPWLDFGFEGIFGRTRFAHRGSLHGLKIYARGQKSVVTSDHQPELKGQLSDVAIRAIGGSYKLDPDGFVGAPRGVAIKRNITQPGSRVTLPKLVGVPIVQTPAAGGTVQNNLLSWNLNTTNRPDFFFVQVLDAMGRPMWHAFSPGHASSVRLPDFPDFSKLPEKKRPEPYPDGSFNMVIIGARHPSLGYNSFSYTDLGFGNFESFSVTTRNIAF